MSKELAKKFLWMRGCIADSFGLKEDFVSVTILSRRMPSSEIKPTRRKLISFWILKDRQKFLSTIKHRILGLKMIIMLLTLNFLLLMETTKRLKIKLYGFCAIFLRIKKRYQSYNLDQYQLNKQRRSFIR